MSSAIAVKGENARSPKETAKQSSHQGLQLKHLLMTSAVSGGMMLGAWFVGYFRFNVTWVLIPSVVYVAVVEFRKSRKSADDDQALLGRVEDLPHWVSTVS